MTLEEFIGECVDRSFKRGYHRAAFLRLRAERGTVPAIRRLVESNALDGGFLRLQELGLTDWTLEAAVLKFPDRFDAKTVDHARARMADDPSPGRDRRTLIVIRPDGNTPVPVRVTHRSGADPLRLRRGHGLADRRRRDIVVVCATGLYLERV